MECGWIKLHRNLINNPIIMKDAFHLAIWTWLLLNAEWESGRDVIFRNARLTLHAGDVFVNVSEMALSLNCERTKIARALKVFESEKQIAKRTDYRNTLVTLLNWSKYQDNAKPNAKPVQSQCKASAKPVTNLLIYKNLRKEEYKNINIKSSSPDREKNLKQYGLNDNVLLTEEEFNSIKRKYPYLWHEKIDAMSNYMEMNHKTYQNHCETLVAWCEKDSQHHEWKPKKYYPLSDCPICHGQGYFLEGQVMKKCKCWSKGD